MLLIAAMIGTYVKQQIDKEREIESASLGKEVEERTVGLNKGDIPPDFTLTNLDGEEVTLSELRGKKLYSIFGQHGVHLVKLKCRICKIIMTNMPRKIMLKY